MQTCVMPAKNVRRVKSMNVSILLCCYFSYFLSIIAVLSYPDLLLRMVLLISLFNGASLANSIPRRTRLHYWEPGKMLCSILIPKTVDLKWAKKALFQCKAHLSMYEDIPYDVLSFNRNSVTGIFVLRKPPKIMTTKLMESLLDDCHRI